MTDGPTPDPYITVKFGCVALLALAGIILLVGVVVSLFTDDTPQTFDEAVESGEPCSVLYEIRNSWPPQYVEIPEWNRTLREIGCTSPTATRTD